MMSRSALVLSAVALLVIATGAAAQDSDGRVPGRILGPDNAPVAGQAVVLHRVQAAAGATVAETITAADGTFTLDVPVEPDPEALYFIATRYDGELYIGAPFRAGEQDPAGQTIMVGVPGTSATAMLGGGAAGMAQPMGRPVTSRNWLLLVIPLVGVAAVAIYALVPRSRVPADRALLIRIAELDERMGAATDPGRASMLEERARLTQQLRAG
jgi:hypothetical protein